MRSANHDPSSGAFGFFFNYLRPTLTFAACWWPNRTGSLSMTPVCITMNYRDEAEAFMYGPNERRYSMDGLFFRADQLATYSDVSYWPKQISSFSNANWLERSSLVSCETIIWGERAWYYYYEKCGLFKGGSRLIGAKPYVFSLTHPFERRPIGHSCENSDIDGYCTMCTPWYLTRSCSFDMILLYSLIKLNNHHPFSSYASYAWVRRVLWIVCCWPVTGLWITIGRWYM